MNEIVANLLQTVSNITETPSGAHNLRVDGRSVGRVSTANIQINPRPDGSGLEIRVKSGTCNESIHIPAVISMGGYNEVVYNDFYIGENCKDILIIAGCGIHNETCDTSQHDGIHAFYVGRNSSVKYVEKHYGEGGQGGQIINPVTEVYLEEDAYMEMDTVQIEGIDSTNRVTRAVCKAGSSLVVQEKIMTNGSQFATTDFLVDLNGEGSSTNIVSRSVAKGNSRQRFDAKINGNNACHGHSECDAIIMDHAVVEAVPALVANHVDATLIHEAAIGKIAGEQITKLMTLGLGQEEAEAQIVNGFLK